ncbi:hypothetical protein PI124_g1676 [Phytophthora idaei]|nr:hypothetical protein PI125_g1544 [Phytophthora idaei]KAG3173042.1 hypothetical protein PI126_g1061 [Phytophthora idaei]KAG3253760.1 hypothetical protein PI124_g1676 [Phytophthora idaei]
MVFATTQALVTNRERAGMPDDVEDEITAVDRYRGNSNNPDDRGAHGGANASELLNPMGRLAGRLSRSSSQNYTRRSGATEMACAPTFL